MKKRLMASPFPIDRPRKLRAFDLQDPASRAGPVIFASPHSGRNYLPEFLQQSRLDEHALRQSEDGYVDLIFDNAPRFGAPLLKALFPRAYVDVNRNKNELDPRMFVDAIPEKADLRSNRVLAGLGVIPRIVADGHDIYGRKLRINEAEMRLRTCYTPYHNALKQLIDRSLDEFGCAVLIDCHSMPSVGGAPLTPGDRAIDFVLGDRFGTSCASSLTSLVERSLTKAGYRVSRNAPYAGGYVASQYGNPVQGVHVLQIEINRALYLNEEKFARSNGFEPLRQKMQDLMARLTQIDPKALQPAIAAE